jgi:hypothetical protein
MRIPIIVIIAVLALSCADTTQEIDIIEVQQWQSHEITLYAEDTFSNPYTDIDLYAEFVNERGDTLRRPGFWYADNIWKIRFAPPESNMIYNWKTYADSQAQGLEGVEGAIKSIPYLGDNTLLKKGFLGVSPGNRNIIYSDGSPFLMIADTPWALPFRGTEKTVTEYAKDRQQKGYNTALLMSVQPDRLAEGPDSREVDYGFGKAFFDLREGHLTEMNADYFQVLDTLIYILHDHEIVPVLQPVFQGFGWKGQEALGRSAVPEEYVRYTKYLLARYGSIPVMYLVSADGSGKEAGIKETGQMLEKWDCYAQPTGLHYSPADDYVPDWFKGDPNDYYKHLNKTYQEEPWLDFQWCQTGHGGEHILYKVEKMYYNKPTKAVANGEPTYERIGNPDNGTGWWQGHEAWSQLVSGGTMGIVYGAAGVWNWKIRSEEPGFEAWSTTNSSAIEAIKFEGSKYPGLLGKGLEGYNLTDMEIGHHLTDNHKLLYKKNVFYASYLPEGGKITIDSLKVGLPVRYYNPQTGAFTEAGSVSEEKQSFAVPYNEPWVLLIGERNTEK